MGFKIRCEKPFLTDNENGGWIKQLIYQNILWDVKKVSDKPVIESNEWGLPEYEVEIELHNEDTPVVDNPPKVAYKKEKKGKGFEQLSLL